MKDEWQKNLSKADFDGHTSFQSLTFDQKLTWLSEAIEATYQLARDNPEANCNRFFAKKEAKSSFLCALCGEISPK